MTRKLIHAADLFCGAGGTSTGLAMACRAAGLDVELLAINHWDVAIDSHTANHPWAKHRCESLDNVDPRKAIPGGRLQLLVASPECTHHSRARGGKPMSDQSRASAWHVLRWAEALYVENILVENVPEFLEWGPIGASGHPLKSKKGETFAAFVSGLRSLGYRVDWKILNAADYGDATTRNRLFVQARRGNRPIAWPEPTHSASGDATLFGARRRWRPAREVIDWSVKGTSIFGRKKPLAPKTLARIAEGLRRFGGESAEPFLIALTHGGRLRSIDDPLPTVTGAHRGELGLVEPFVIGQQSGAVARSVGEPLPTIATSGAVALVEPFLVPFYGERAGQPPRTHAVSEPVPTIPASAAKFGLVEPFVVPMNRDDAPHSVDRPLRTITATSADLALVEPFLVSFYGNGSPSPISSPVPTVTTKDRFGLVEQYGVDIRFRMLQPHELAAAMGFPAEYQFSGNREARVRQIGNAVPVNLAKALCSALLGLEVRREEAA